LSADGCLQNLDSYTRKAIEKYGRYLLDSKKQEIELLKEDLKIADLEYIKIVKRLTKLEEESKK
jgi:hypothetical protein